MKVDPKTEVVRLYDLEYGDTAELIIRFLGICLGNVLIVVYWDEPLLWSWGFFFFLSHLVYFSFLRRAKERPSNSALTWSVPMFLAVMTSFLWLPAYLTTQEDPSLVSIGSALIGTILVFLVRRADTMPLMIAGQILVAFGIGIAVISSIVVQMEHWPARIGMILSGCALLGYFAKALLVSREQRLKATEVANRSLQVQKMNAVGQLAGGVAHDFNNNLTAIMGNLELMKILTDEDQKEACLNDAILASQQASHTVRQLLTYARQEPTDHQPVSPDELLSDLQALTRRLIPASVKTVFHCEGSLPHFIADKGQLTTAVINLITNAVDAMPDGGLLSVTGKLQKVGTACALHDGSRLPIGLYVVFEITDTGTGIPSEILDKVLDPFFTTKPVGKGTGLGLAMVFAMTRNLGGGIDIKTSETGTTFSIFVPARPSG